MNSNHHSPCATAFFACVLASSLTAQTVIDFQDLDLSSPPTTVNATGGVYYNGSDGAGGFTSHGVSFVTNYNASWGSWDGWAYSTVSDTATAGWNNQYASYAGGGNGDSTFVIGYAGYGLSLQFPSAVALNSAFLTNGTYPGLSMSLGDDFAKQFGGADGSDPDFLLLSITGKDAGANTTGMIEFYLADFRSSNPADDYILDTWTEVDLSSLGTAVTSLDFVLTSSDNGDWGMNTPAYFAMDSLSFVAVPEGGTLPFILGAWVALLCLRRRQR